MMQLPVITKQAAKFAACFVIYHFSWGTILRILWDMK